MVSIRVCFLAVLAVVPSAVLAENWLEYSSATNGTVYSFDRDSMKGQGTSTVIVWVLADYSKNKSEKARSTKIRYSVSCTNETVTLLSYVDYGPDGNIMRNRLYKPYELEAQPIVPGSTGTDLLAAVCS